LGDHIAALHLKDFRFEGGRKHGDLPAGTGSLEWKTLLGLVAQRKPGVDLLLDNSVPATARGTIAFLRETAGGLV
jgi:sugar phosphate isomerase/epimerase